MLKLFLSTIILIASLNASSFNEKIINIIGYDEYRINKSLIDYLFSNKNAYYLNGSLDYISVIEKLKYNGLLKTAFKSPKNLTITFKINADPIKSLKIISDSLRALGYYQYATKKLIYYKNTNLAWTITLRAQAAIDPLMLSKELFKHKCLLLDIRKEGDTKWVYVLNTSNSTVSKEKLIIAGEKVDLRKPLKPYFIKVNNVNSVSITSKSGNQWFPYIVFYDKHLNILEIVKKNKKHKEINIKVPYDTEYIKINDIYTLANLKRGLSVLIEE